MVTPNASKRGKTPARSTKTPTRRSSRSLSSTRSQEKTPVRNNTKKTSTKPNDVEAVDSKDVVRIHEELEDDISECDSEDPYRISRVSNIKGTTISPCDNMVVNLNIGCPTPVIVEEDYSVYLDTVE